MSRNSSPLSEAAKSQILATAKRQFWRLAFLLALVFASSIAGLIAPLLTGRVFDALTAGSYGAVGWLTVGVVASALLAGLLDLVQGYQSIAFTEYFSATLRGAIIERFQKGRLDELQRLGAGELINRMWGDVDVLSNAMTSAVLPTVAAVTTIVTTFLAMFWANWRLALVVLITLPAIVIALRPARDRLAPYRLQLSKGYDAMIAFLQELLSLPGIILTKTLGLYARNDERFATMNGLLVATKLKAALEARKIQVGVILASSLPSSMLIFVGVWLIARHDATVGALIAFMSLQQRLMPPIGSLANIHMQLANLYGILGRLDQSLTLLAESSGTVAPASGPICLDDVSVSYGEAFALKNVTCTIPAVGYSAIVGESGAGKSSLLSVLLRLREPTSGRITFGDVPIEQCSLAELRRMIGYVAQDSSLMDGTVEENVKLGCPAASSGEVLRALQSAQALAFVEELPEGLAYRVGPRGELLSGGQRQRIALARALLQGARMIILDEATSALDVFNDHAIQETLRELASTHSVIVVTHRINVTQHADVVLVFQDGNLVETGTPGELLERNGAYAAMAQARSVPTRTLTATVP